MNMVTKRYVDVDICWHKDGTLLPKAMYWETESETQKFEIEKVLSGPRSMASQAGGVGKRYEVQIHSRKRCLFLEKDRWFIECVR